MEYGAGDHQDKYILKYVCFFLKKKHLCLFTNCSENVPNIAQYKVMLCQVWIKFIELNYEAHFCD